VLSFSKHEPWFFGRTVINPRPHFAQAIGSEDLRGETYNTMTSMPEPPINPTASFLNYAPVPLAFGTSGLRGLVKDITDLETYINVKGALRYLLTIGDIHTGSTVVLAGDLRPSTDRIMRASAQAIVDSGCRVENAGKIPTPALVSHAISTGRAGVMVTGSHIPFNRTGIKINKSVGEVLKSDESGITREVERVRVEEYSRTATTSAFDASGMFKRAPELPPLDRSGEEAYVRRYVTSFTRGSLSGVRVLVYQHSAVGRDILPHILRALDAEVVTAGRSETFVSIDTENVTDEQLDRLEEFAVAAEASGQPLHAIVSTDGDSDRPLVTAVLPAAEVHAGGRRVRFLPGDLLGIVAAEYLRADAVAVPISANDAVERRMGERGVVLEKTRIGSPYVISALDELRRAGTHARIAGWEANGGFLTGSDIPLAAGTLMALPTRDSTLPILANLFAAAEQRIGLAALWNRLPARFGRAGLLDNVPVAVSQAILAHLIPPGDVIEVEFDGTGRVFDRSRPGAPPTPLTEPAIQDWQQRKAMLMRFFTPALGFDDIVRINILDGVRVYFRNGDVAHVRPSGNAPQLRVYANSDSQARADQIVELALREPDGILRQLERGFT
jgi:phosphomannomutase